MWDVGKTREQLLNFECSTNIPTLLLYNNPEDARFFHGFTDTITHSWLTSQSMHIGLGIIQVANNQFKMREYFDLLYKWNNFML